MKALWYVVLLSVGTFALLAGAFLGFSSCGGVAWHRPALSGLLAAVAIGSCFLPSWGQRPLASRAAFLVGVLVTFVLAQSAGAQFYPANPATVTEFVAGLWRDLLASAC
jgi:hypothetical protein